MKIASSAILSPRAEISEDVEIGAHVLIGDGVVIGPGCRIDARAVIEGDTILGENNRVGAGAVLGGQPQDFAFSATVRSSLRIGAGNFFAENVTVHRGTKEGSSTVVGDGCRILAGAHLGHNVRLGNNVVVAGNCLLGGYVEVGDATRLGSGSVFHQFLRIGPLALVRCHTRCVKDIPPYVVSHTLNILSGINAAGLRLAGWSPDARREMQRAFHLVYGSGLNVSQALAEAGTTRWSPAVAVFFDFIASSKRGVCRSPRPPSPSETPFPQLVAG